MAIPDASAEGPGRASRVLRGPPQLGRALHPGLRMFFPPPSSGPGPRGRRLSTWCENGEPRAPDGASRHPCPRTKSRRGPPAESHTQPRSQQAFLDGGWRHNRTELEDTSGCRTAGEAAVQEPPQTSAGGPQAAPAELRAGLPPGVSDVACTRSSTSAVPISQRKELRQREGKPPAQARLAVQTPRSLDYPRVPGAGQATVAATIQRGTCRGGDARG